MSFWRRLWSRLLLMLSYNPRHTWHSAQSQLLPWPWGMLARWQQLESRLIKNVTIVVIVRSFFFAFFTTVCITDSCCLEAKGYDMLYFSCIHTHSGFIHWILEGTCGSDLCSFKVINRGDKKSWKIKRDDKSYITENRSSVCTLHNKASFNCTCSILIWVWTGHFIPLFYITTGERGQTTYTLLSCLWGSRTMGIMCLFFSEIIPAETKHNSSF